MEKYNQVSYKTAAKIYKVIVIGDPNVGKTCLTYRFCEGRFPDTPEATIGVDFREKLLDINGDKVRLQLWDTAGQERFRRSMVPHYYRNAHAIAFVFDMGNHESYEHLGEWIAEAERHSIASTKPQRVLIGNKCDLERRCVSETELQQFADRHRMPLFETSAKRDAEADHVEAVFLTIAHRLHNAKTLTLPLTVNEVHSPGLQLSSEASSSSSCYC